MTKFRNALHNEKGFTLIELLVVIIIIGILAAVALPNLMGASEGAREKRLNADFRTFEAALEVYYTQWSAYPAPGDSSTLLKDAKGIDSVIKSVPSDPWGKDYQYSATEPTTGYTITDKDAKGTLTQEGIQ